MSYRTADAPVSTLLKQLRVASPCAADWDAMPGTDRVRQCHGCGKRVFNISSMDRAEAELFLRENTGETQPCVRFHQRRDGTVITSDCPIGRTLKVARVATALVGGPLLYAFLLLLVAMLTGHFGHARVMGQMGR
ncbi:MAG: hypothetical protein ACHREM_26715 [Polyangiales bacterium]